MGKSDFFSTLKNYLNGRLSKRKKADVDNWLDSLGKNAPQTEWSESNQGALYDRILGEINNTEKMTTQQKPNTIFWLKAAALIVLMAGASYGTVWYILRSNQSIVEKTILNDGTIVWLKKDSKLSYYENTDGTKRYARLSGEGLFEVAKQNRPFMVQSGNTTIKVMGTSFTLKIVNDSVVLKVLTGRVSVSSDSVSIDVLPGEKVAYAGKGELKKSTMTNEDKPKIIEATEYNMQFSNTEMKIVLDRVEKKFNAIVTVSDKQLMKCRVTGDLTDRSLESTLQILSEILDIQYTIKQNSVAITGKGCN